MHYIKTNKKWLETTKECVRARATVGCFLVFHEIKGPFSFKQTQYPVVLRLSVVSAAQSASL